MEEGPVSLLALPALFRSEIFFVFTQNKGGAERAPAPGAPSLDPPLQCEWRWLRTKRSRLGEWNYEPRDLLADNPAYNLSECGIICSRGKR